MVKPASKAPMNKASDLVEYDAANGPFWACEPDAEQVVRFAKTGSASEKMTPSKTLIEVFQLARKKRPNKIVLRSEGMKALKKGQKAPGPVPLNQWKLQWTWTEYERDVRLCAKAMIKCGVEQHDAVNVFGFNSPEWLIAQLGSTHAGAKCAGIYPSDNAEQVQFKSFHSNASLALCQNESSFGKFAEVIEDLPYMKAIVCWACEELPSDLTRSDGSVVKVYSFKDFLDMGKEVEEKVLEERIALIKPGHCCALIYTSGTTGRPKAVMISHDNLAFESNSVLPLAGIGLKAEEERILSYLPLSHVAGMMLDCVCPIIVTAYQKGWLSVNFARVYDLKIGTIGARLTTVQPTFFLGVPRVWEKVMEKLKAVGAQTKGLKKKLAATAKKKGLQAQMNQQLGGNGKTPFMYGIYSILLKAIKGKLGLSKCKVALAGAAPMTYDCLSYFGSLGINVNEAYGMSECTGVTTWSTDHAHQWGTVGFSIPGAETRVFKVEDDGTMKECPPAKNILKPTEAEQGEICFRGRHIMMGYMANPKLGDDHVEEIKKKNAGAIDKDGWLHSGDKGAISAKGMVRITGRYKELIIGAGGENIAPVPLEDNLKKLLPFVSNVMMVGDKRKFNTLLLSVKCVGASGELPGTNELDAEAKVFGKTIEDCAKNEKFVEAVTNAIKATNEDGDVCPSNAARIQKFTLLPIDFSVDTGELTATLKLKRSVVNDKYIDIIDAMYESKDTFVPYSVVAPYAEAGKADPVPEGSFKATEPLTLVDDDHVKDIQAAEEEAGEEEE